MSEQALIDLGIPYQKKPDGTLLVTETIDLSKRGLEKLPDLSDVTVEGDFFCSFNKLRNLVGAPKSVSGYFNAEHNELTSLQGSPETAGEGFNCDSNRLANLKGGPRRVGGYYACARNFLDSLEGAPLSTGGYFGCDANLLSSMVGMPQEVGGSIICTGNPLDSLEGIPKTFSEVRSDFGDYDSWDAIPENIRVAPENRMAALIENSTVLQRRVAIRKPVTIRR